MQTIGEPVVSVFKTEDHDSDEALAGLAAKGDQRAFESLLLKYQDRVYSLLARVCGSAQEAEDLAQETFIKAYRGLSSFRQGSKFYTWLFRIAVNTAYSRGRKLVRIKRHESVSLEATLEQGREDGVCLRELAVSDVADPELQMEQRQLQEQIEAGIQALSEDHRTILILREVEGLDYAEIGQTLALTPAAVKSRIHRARQELARILKDLNPH